ncbi:hypothetical protein [Microbacterium candidum]|uniref:Uncharacterized protein n=1 Tax=Microbacterium candidum TaxID=3041922 RepID=A0ABT7N056_9MICO|nr:hypothetical protein [Microbacterium sp. ASV49]MDL9980082.1 hypothetical protein [Microbacterium sp. ASV49]
MNGDLQETIKSAVTENVATAMKVAMGVFAEALNGLATHMDERFEGRLENLEDSTREGFDRVDTTLEGIIPRLDDDEVERAALTAQLNRREDWIVEAAPVVRVDYAPGS